MNETNDEGLRQQTFYAFLSLHFYKVYSNAGAPNGVMKQK